MKIPQIVENFCNYLNHLNRSKLTVDQYKTDLVLFLQFLRASKGRSDFPTAEECAMEPIDDVTVEELEKVTSEDIYRFMRYVSEERGNKAGARARKLSSIKSFFKYLVHVKEAFEVNPSENISTPKLDKRLPKHLTLEESEELLSAIEKDEDSRYKERDFCIITLFLNCGMRLSELVGINLSDIERDLSKLRVVGKGSKERLIYLNEACREAIREYLPKRSMGQEIKEKNALFISRLGKRLSKQSVQHIVYKYLENAGLGYRHLSVHKLRHTAATLMYQEGHVDVRVLKDILGHEQLNTTQIYTHVSDEQMKNAMEQNPLSKKSRKK